MYPRVRRDDRLLGRRGGDDRGGGRRGLDAHRRPGGDGRRRVRADRGADQGRDHPRRGERVPAGGGGVPAHDSGRGRGAGDRGAVREVRRGGGGVGAVVGRRGADGGRPAGVVFGEDRDVQDPAALEVRGRLPADGDGEGA